MWVTGSMQLSHLAIGSLYTIYITLYKALITLLKN